MNISERFIDVAIEEARISLREGKSGLGTLIIRDNKIISKAHDTDKTSKDPTAHAEINAIRLAAKKYRVDFDNYMLISTKFRFKRNYDKIRPYTPFCEEMIVFDKATISGNPASPL
jgi:pyrimidine deaminase RibD-like protein